MKVTLIHGQNHVGSSCTIGRMLADKVSKKEEQREFFLPRDLNHFCTGCCRCLEGEENCPFYGEKKKILEAMEVSDLLIFTTPTYCMRCSGPMKSFLDLTFSKWMVHRPMEAMFHKKAVVISTAAGSGAGSAVKDVKNALTFWGVPEIRTLAMAVQAMGWDQVKPQKQAQIQGKLEKLAGKLSRGKAPRAGFKTRFLFEMMRKMQGGGMGASPAERVYWDEMGWLGKARPWKA